MNALERIAIERGVVDAKTLDEQQELWALAVRNTPHGVALSLENAYLPHDHEHDHDHAHGMPGAEKLKPVGVSPLGAE